MKNTSSYPKQNAIVKLTLTLEEFIQKYINSAS